MEADGAIALFAQSASQWFLKRGRKMDQVLLANFITGWLFLLTIFHAVMFMQVYRRSDEPGGGLAVVVAGGVLSGTVLAMLWIARNNG